MALPTPTSAPAVAGHLPVGTISYVWMSTVANINAPTSAEMSAGTDYRFQIAAIQGFAPQGNTVDQPNAGSRITPNVPGLVTLGDGTLTFNLSKTGTGDVRSVFNDGVDGTAPTTGYLAVCYEGITTGGQMRVFQATVIKTEASSALDAVQTLDVQFALQAATKFIAVPTA